MSDRCPICDEHAPHSGACGPCLGLLRWFRDYFGFALRRTEEITFETRFVEDLGVESLDWMSWPLEAEEKLGVSLDDRTLEGIRTVGQFVRALRRAGAEWPESLAIRLVPRRHWWDSYRWVAVDAAADRTPSLHEGTDR